MTIISISRDMSSNPPDGMQTRKETDDIPKEQSDPPEETQASKETDNLRQVLIQLDAKSSAKQSSNDTPPNSLSTELEGKIYLFS
jgi:hypothetical protein